MNEIKAKLAELTALTRKVMKRQHDELDEQIHNLATEIAEAAEAENMKQMMKRANVQPMPRLAATYPDAAKEIADQFGGLAEQQSINAAIKRNQLDSDEGPKAA